MPSPPVAVEWRTARLTELTALEVARLYRVRQEVFVVEQDCVYLDADELDERSYHVVAWTASTEPLACARLVDPGARYVEPSMGRVLTAAAVRGTGLGRELVGRVLALHREVHPGLGLRISAQAYLRRFYGELGFAAVGEGYLEDGIPHVEMVLAPPVP